MELGSEVQNRYLNLFMLKLRRSGYSQKFRKEIADSILKAYKKMVEEDISGTKPLFRSRDWRRRKKRQFRNQEKS